MNPAQKLHVASGDGRVAFRLDGQCSALVGFAIQRFIKSVGIGPAGDVFFDLSRASALESTFAGVMLDLAKQGMRTGRPFVHLVTPSPVVVDSLRKMGLTRLFDVCSTLPEPIGPWTCIEVSGVDPDELAEVIIRSHESLIEADPQNEAAFRGVVDGFKAARRRGTQ